MHSLQNTSEYVTKEKHQRSSEAHLPIHTLTFRSRSIWILHTHKDTVQTEQQAQSMTAESDWVKTKSFVLPTFPPSHPCPCSARNKHWWTPLIWRVQHVNFTLKQNYDSAKIKKKTKTQTCSFKVWTFPSTMDTHCISSTSCQFAATSQKVVVTQIWSFLVLCWSFPYNIMLRTQKLFWDLQLQEEIIVWAPQREQKPFIQVEITSDLKSRCTVSYPLILNARANYWSHLTQCHAAPVCVLVHHKRCSSLQDLKRFMISKNLVNGKAIIQSLLFLHSAPANNLLHEASKIGRKNPPCCFSQTKTALLNHFPCFPHSSL